MMRLVYLNGRIVPETRASVSVFDRGFNYGDGVFETLLVKGGRPVYLKEHLKRLKEGIKILGIPAAGVKGLMRDIKDGAIAALAGKNGLKGDANVKIIVTRGVGPGGHAPKKDAVPTIVMIARPIDENALSISREKGIRAVTVNGLMPSLPGIKSLNYLPNIIGKDIALRSGADEAIFMDKDGIISEGTSSNIFIVKNSVILTPALGKGPSEGPLPGVVREAVIRLAKKRGLKVKETTVHKKDLYGCDEAFLTNSIIGAVPLIEIDKRPVKDGRPGPLTRAVQGLLGAEIGRKPLK
ncbi:MAG: aminotransferase class IV [Deltaproteobacteria bacterium]|nr:aminotransferase class IV [Deltaproteobacteria bacterium]